MRRLFGGNDEPSPAVPPTLTALTSAFLEVDRRFSELDTAVRDAQEVAGDGDLASAWAPLVDRFGAATERYMWASGSEQGTRPPTAADQDACGRELNEIAAAMDRFRSRNESRIASARGARAVSERKLLAARTAANGVTTRLESPEAAPYLQLTTVGAATDALIAAMGRLDGAPDVPTRDTAADEVDAAAAQVHAALDAAPGLPDAARRAIASATTRLSAVRTRAEGLGPTRSAILREFSSECSADLVDNDRVAADEARAAEAALQDAQRCLATESPDGALDAVSTARDHLERAGRAVDAVTERLRLLREVRADTNVPADKARFKLRDAQHLAVQKRLVGEWGSVLDAQHDRIERASQALERVHPDYWRYLQELEAVERDIAQVVSRMRGTANP